MTITEASHAVQAAMKTMGIKGSYDVRFEGSRSTGWIGKPTGEDFEVVVTIKSLPSMDA
jgi:hypothetical protein